MTLRSFDALTRRALRQFGSLLPAEARLLAALPTGTVVDLADPPGPGGEDPADPYAWAAWRDRHGRTVRAEFLRWICVTPALHGWIDPKGIQLSGALVPDRLDLAAIDIPFGLRLIDCALPFGVDLAEARLTSVDFARSFLHALHADSLQLSGSLSLWPGVRCTAGVNLQGARIAGDIGMDGVFTGGGGPALDAQRIRADGAFVVGARARFDGTVTLRHCVLRGYVDLRSVRFRSRTGIALDLDFATIGGAVHLEERTRLLGGLSLMGATIGGDLHLSGSNFRGRAARNEDELVEADGGAIMGDQVRVGGSIMMRGTIAHGAVRFSRARVEQDTDLSGARIRALRGPVHPLWIGRSLQVDAAHLAGPVFLVSGFRADALVDFGETTFDQSITIECSIDADGDGSPRGLNLAGARVHGDLRLVRVGPRDAAIRTPIRLFLMQANVTSLADSEGFWHLVAPGGLRLDGFEYSAIADGSPTSSKFRIPQFLGKQWEDPARPNTFYPGPYRVLARVLRESGHDSEANRVLIAMERTRRRASAIRRLDRHPRPARGLSWGWLRARCASVGWGAWDTILDVTIRFGYRSTLALAWMLLVWVACTVVFSLAYDARVMSPSAAGTFAARDPREARTAEKWRGGYSVPTHYPTFHPALYSLDVLLPVVDLHQESDWLPLEPDRVRELLDSGREGELGLPSTVRQTARIGDLERLSAVASVALPVESLLGWFLTTMFLAGLSGMIDRK